MCVCDVQLTFSIYISSIPFPLQVLCFLFVQEYLYWLALVCCVTTFIMLCRMYMIRCPLPHLSNKLFIFFSNKLFIFFSILTSILCLVSKPLHSLSLLYSIVINLIYTTSWNYHCNPHLLIQVKQSSIIKYKISNLFLFYSFYTIHLKLSVYH
jgi:hypothetical protein